MILIMRRMPPATNWDVLHLYSISNMIQISSAPRLYSVDPHALSLVRRGSSKLSAM